jgi:tripeptide aminopeptidase
VFFDADAGHLCRIHTAAGLDALPSACRHFPRIVLHDDRGVFISLSHFCPTAAAMLLDGRAEALRPTRWRGEAPPYTVGIRVVEAPASLDIGHLEGFEARGALPPLLRPGVLTDLAGYDAWERRRFARSPSTTSARRAHCWTSLEAATRADGAPSTALSRPSRFVRRDRPAPCQSSGSRGRRARGRAHADGGMRFPANAGQRGGRRWARGLAPFGRAVNRYLAARLFANAPRLRGAGAAHDRRMAAQVPGGARARSPRAATRRATIDSSRPCAAPTSCSSTRPTPARSAGRRHARLKEPPVKTSALERFLRYVTFDTRSDESSTSTPSTPGQLVLARVLVDELLALGLTDATLDAHGYVMATIPATVERDVPTIGFIAHVDTSPEMDGAAVTPIVHERYDGRDIVLPDDPSAVLRTADNPGARRPHRRRHRHRLRAGRCWAPTTRRASRDHGGGRVSDGASGDPARRDPDRLHAGRGDRPRRGPLRRRAFGAVAAYTLDGGSRGELEYESFSADAITVTFHGFNTHPGYAKGRMVNAIKLAAEFVARLPHHGLSPETTDGREGYVHPYQMHASVERTSVKVLLRDFTTEGLREQQALVERIAREVVDSHPASRSVPAPAAGELTVSAPAPTVTFEVQESYRNMREVLDRHPHVVEHAREAMRRAGIEPIERPIRGGTDGSRLSFMGLPTPNLFAGEHNFHSRLEWVSAQDMDKAVEVIVHLSQVWAEPYAERRSPEGLTGD